MYNHLIKYAYGEKLMKTSNEKQCIRQKRVSSANTYPRQQCYQKSVHKLSSRIINHVTKLWKKIVLAIFL